MKLNDHLYLVGGGDFGFNLSGRLDANSYILDTGEGLWMIDAGFDGGEQVVSNIRAEGLDPRQITRLFVTHYHADHAGALAFMRKALSPDLKIAISGEVAEQVREADEEDNGLRWAKSFGFYPSEFDLEPCDVDIELTGDQRFQAGPFTLTAIDTPGHCRGHICFLVTGGAEGGYLFSGDHVFWGGKIILQNVGDSNLQQYAASMNALLDYDFTALLPGHLSFSMANGKRHVELAASQFNKIGLPANLL
jgi:glyoxylase-like metal-dependent hydrolase (beta-lactamase superfamily II)